MSGKAIQKGEGRNTGKEKRDNHGDPLRDRAVCTIVEVPSEKCTTRRSWGYRMNGEEAEDQVNIMSMSPASASGTTTALASLIR